MKMWSAARLVIMLGICGTCTALSSCPAGWRPFREHCYYFSHDYQNWKQAEYNCLSMGSHLTSIWDRDELILLKDMMEHYKHAQIWVGLWHIEDQHWRWTDGTLYFYSVTHWSRSEPSKIKGNRCGKLYDYLHSMDCFSRLRYICKRHLDETPLTFPKCPPIPKCPTIPKCPDVTCPSIPPCPPCPNLTLPTIPAPTTCPPSPPATTCPSCTTPTVALLPADPSPTMQTSTNWELVTCGSPTGQPSCSSRDVTCSCLLTMVANPKGGFQAAIDEGLAVGRSIVIRGRAKTNVTKLLFNLNVHKDGDGDDDEDDGDEGGGDSSNKITTGLHLKFDLAKQMVLVNSKVAGTWGNKQTKNLPQHRPFGPGHAFKIVIKCGVSAFNITFNDDLQLDLKYAVSDLQSINWLEGWQVMLTSVQLV